jgi:uncharacterized membrane protein
MRRLRLFGHPLHPPSTHLPLGLLMAAPLADIAALAGAGPVFWAVSFWVLAAGLAAGLLAGATGLLDYLSLENGHPGERDAVRHMLDLCSFLARGGPSPLAGGRSVLAAVLSVLAASVLSVGGWYGGKLVYHHRIGLDDRR